MTDDELAAIRARAEAARAATEGPTLSDQLAAWFDDGPRKMADSQRDVPALLAEVERLRAMLTGEFVGEGGWWCEREEFLYWRRPDRRPSTVQPNSHTDDCDRRVFFLAELRPEPAATV